MATPKGRYYQVSFEGRDLFQVWASDARNAKRKAVSTMQREGRAGRNLALVEVR